MFIIDYLSVINPNCKPTTPEETKKNMDFVSNLRKKFGTVLVIPNTDKLISNEEN